MKRQQGFTLIEVMVAILLMAIVSLVAWRGLDSVSRADRHVQQSTEHTGALLRVFNQLERDLALRASTELQEPARPGAAVPAESAIVAVRVKGDADSDGRLELIRRSAESGEGLQRVRWWLQGRTLYRAAAPARDRYPLPAPKAGVAVLEDVGSFRLRVWTAGRGWQMPDDKAGDNPQGLEIQLVRQGAQGSERYRQVLGPFN